MPVGSIGFAHSRVTFLFSFFSVWSRNIHLNTPYLTGNAGKWSLRLYLNRITTPRLACSVKQLAAAFEGSRVVDTSHGREC